MNKIIIIGNITREPEMKYTQAGDAIVTINVAVNSPYKDKNGDKITTFFSATFFKKTAEIIGDYCQTGSKVCVEGEMRREEYKDKDGVKKSTWKIMGDKIHLLGSKQDSKPSNGGFKKAHKAPFNDTIDEPSDESLDDELERNQPYGF